MRLARLYRYPVKGLSPEPLTAATLSRDGYFPGDRLYAIENGPSGFDPASPAHQPKIKFLMLMRQARLAALETRYDEATSELSIRRDGEDLLRARLGDIEGRRAIAAFFAAYCGEDTRKPLNVLRAPEGFRFVDSKSGFVSLINLASVADLGRVVGRELDPLRFRANLYFDGAAAWHEASWPGRVLRIGPVVLEAIKMIDRCPATGVDPRTGARDLDLVAALRGAFGHIDCGVYARVVEGGRIAAGDPITLGD
jgi:uncharacterized protein YcbX